MLSDFKGTQLSLIDAPPGANDQDDYLSAEALADLDALTEGREIEPDMTPSPIKSRHISLNECLEEPRE